MEGVVADLGVAVEHGLHHGLPVDGELERLPHPGVVEGLGAHVHLDGQAGEVGALGGDEFDPSVVAERARGDG